MYNILRPNHCTYVYRYMKRRCEFLDSHPHFNFNPGKAVNPGKSHANTEKLGSTLMRTMLKEVREFCDPSIRDQKSHQQVCTFSYSLEWNRTHQKKCLDYRCVLISGVKINATHLSLGQEKMFSIIIEVFLHFREST